MTTPEQVGAVAPVLMRHPERCPGRYVMHFYCKYENPAHPFQMSNIGLYMLEADQVETRGQAIAQMRADGWIYHRDGTATCPICVKALNLNKGSDAHG